MELYLCTKKKTDALVKYNVEMTKSATNALCNYEESNLGLTEKLRSKEKLRVQKYEDQVGNEMCAPSNYFFSSVDLLRSTNFILGAYQPI